MADKIVQTLGKYTILEEIGRGGFATVYRAEDTVLGREVALKVLDPLLMRDEAFVARFQREARAAASLEHSQIVPIYDVGEGEGRLFIAMRLVRGESLAKALARRARFSWDEMLHILRQVGEALRYAHAEGIIHRDIKPDNILLDERSGAMLSDFGFARLLGTSSLTQSISGGIVGTPAYIAPEIWEDAEATPATDVYALGCVVYEMLTGKALFAGSTPMAVMRAHDQGATLPPDWPVDIPQALSEVLQRAVARQPAARYASVADFLAALEGLQTAAMAERIAAEAARLLAQAQQALEARRYQDAITAADALLALQPQHEEGLTVLQQAQAHQSRYTELAAQLAEKTTALEQDERTLAEAHTALEARITQLAQEMQAQDAESAQLQSEKARIKARLQELEQQRQEHGEQDKALQKEQRRWEKARQKLAEQRQHWEQAARLLEAGDWEGVSHYWEDASESVDEIPERLLEEDGWGWGEEDVWGWESVNENDLVPDHVIDVESLEEIDLESVEEIEIPEATPEMPAQDSPIALQFSYREAQESRTQERSDTPVEPDRISLWQIGFAVTAIIAFLTIVAGGYDWGLFFAIAAGVCLLLMVLTK